MNVSREIKKAEAITRMKRLKLHSPCVKAFEKHDEVWLTEPFGGLYEFSGNEELVEQIKEFEREYNGLVYHVIHTPTEFGDLYNFLYVSDYIDEYEMDREDIAAGYAFVYVLNTSIPEFSEFGTIAVQERFGGIVRVG